MAAIVQELIQREEIVIAMIIAAAVVAVSIAKTIAGTTRAMARERTRREIAAYIAEGSMTPEQGERLMAAGDRREHV